MAIATPGMALPPSLRVNATMPALPPKKAINTSHRVGWVRAKSSLCASFSGVSRKYSVAVTKLMAMNTIILRAAWRISAVSPTAAP